MIQHISVDAWQRSFNWTSEMMFITEHVIRIN